MLVASLTRREVYGARIGDVIEKYLPALAEWDVDRIDRSSGNGES